MLRKNWSLFRPVRMNKKKNGRTSGFHNIETLIKYINSFKAKEKQQQSIQKTEKKYQKCQTIKDKKIS